MTSSYKPTPKLDLDFTTGNLDAIVGFSRAGNTATRVDSSGIIDSVAADTPRFDYDPITFVCRGLLIEEQKTNLYLQSSAFGTLPWLTQNASITSNTATAPDGISTADTLTCNTGVAGSSYVRQYAVLPSGTTHTQSFFIKPKTSSVVQVAEAAYTGWQCTYDISTGVITPAGSVSGTMTRYNDGWYRLTFTYPYTVGQTDSYLNINCLDCYIWGGQLEAGSFSTSYIPTAITSSTRNADIAIITGTNFSDWWQSSKGGVFVRARPGTVSGTRPWVQFDDGTANEIIALRGNTTDPELYIVDGGIVQAQIDAGTIAANTDYGLTGWWETNDCKARLDSGAVVSDYTATIPAVTQARLGSDGTNYLNGHLSSISYYDSFSEQIYTRRKNKAVFSLL